jgi:hypothetical protein
MSSSGDRRKAEPVSWADPMQVLAILEHNRRIAELMAAVGRLHGGGAALEEAKRQFWADGIALLHPVPGQRLDTPLTNVPITKKGVKVSKKLKKERKAWELSKRSGVPFLTCLNAYDRVLMHMIAS